MSYSAASAARCHMNLCANHNTLRIKLNKATTAIKEGGDA
jgi:hypothetical protein